MKRPITTKFWKYILCLFFSISIIESYATTYTYTVSNNSNTGAGSLRQAITDANACTGCPGGTTDLRIEFAITGTGPSDCNIYGNYTIELSTALPNINPSYPLVIDGTTNHTSSNVNTRVYISNNGIGNAIFFRTANTNNLTIKGLGFVLNGTDPNFTTAVLDIRGSGSTTSAEVIIDDVEILNITSNGSSSGIVYSSQENTTVKNSLFKDITTTSGTNLIRMAANNCFIDNNVFYNNNGIAVIALSTVSGLEVTNNTFIGCATGVRTQHDAVVTGNYFYHASGLTSTTGISVFTSGEGTLVQGNTFASVSTVNFSFNSAPGCNALTGLSSTGAYTSPITTSVGDVEIRNNRIYSVGTSSASAIAHSGTGADGVIIDGNIIGYDGTYDASKNWGLSTKGIAIAGSNSGHEITNNTFYNIGNNCIQLSTAVGASTISDNTILYAYSSAPNSAAVSSGQIYVGLMHDNTVISGNKVYGSGYTSGTGVAALYIAGGAVTSTGPHVFDNEFGGELTLPGTSLYNRVQCHSLVLGATGTVCSGIVIDNNYIYGAMGSGICFASTTAGYNWITVTGNKIGLKPGWDTAPASQRNNYVLGNAHHGITFQSTGAYELYIGVTSTGVADGNIISGNEGNGMRIVSYSGATSTGVNFRIMYNTVGRPRDLLDDNLLGTVTTSMLQDGNVFGNGYMYAPANFVYSYTTTSAGIYIEGTTSSNTRERTVQENYVYKNFGKGISVITSANVLISKNEAFANQYVIGSGSYDPMDPTTLGYNINLCSSCGTPGNANVAAPQIYSYDVPSDVLTGKSATPADLATTDYVELFKTTAQSKADILNKPIVYVDQTNPTGSPVNWSFTSKNPSRIATMVTRNLTNKNSTPFNDATPACATADITWGPVCINNTVTFTHTTALADLPTLYNGSESYRITYTWSQYIDGTGWVAIVSSATCSSFPCVQTFTAREPTAPYTTNNVFDTELETVRVKLDITTDVLLSGVVQRTCTSQSFGIARLETALGVYAGGIINLCKGSDYDLTPYYAQACDSYFYTWDLKSFPSGCTNCNNVTNTRKEGLVYPGTGTDDNDPDTYDVDPTNDKFPTTITFDTPGTYVYEISVADNSFAGHNVVVSDIVTFIVTEYPNASYKREITDCGYKLFYSLNEIFAHNNTATTCYSPSVSGFSECSLNYPYYWCEPNSLVAQSIKGIGLSANISGNLEALYVKELASNTVRLKQKIMTVPLSCNFNSNASAFNRQVEMSRHFFTGSTNPTYLYGTKAYDPTDKYFGLSLYYTALTANSSSDAASDELGLNWGGVNPYQSLDNYHNLDYTYYGECAVFPLAMRVYDLARAATGSSSSLWRNSVYRMKIYDENHNAVNMDNIEEIDIATLKVLQYYNDALPAYPQASGVNTTSDYSAANIRFDVNLLTAVDGQTTLSNCYMLNGYSTTYYQYTKAGTELKSPEIIASQNEICSESTDVTLTVYPAGKSSYEFTYPVGAVPTTGTPSCGSTTCTVTLTTNTITFSTTEPGNYSVYIDELHEKCDESSWASGTASTVIKIVPSAAFTLNDYYCKGDVAALTFNPGSTTYLIQPHTVNWYVDAGSGYPSTPTSTFTSTATSTVSTYNYTFATVGLYNIKQEIIAGGCTTVAVHQTRVLPEPVAIYSLLQGILCKGASTGEVSISFEQDFLDDVDALPAGITCSLSVAGSTFPMTVATPTFNIVDLPEGSATFSIIAHYIQSGSTIHTCTTAVTYNVAYWGVSVAHCTINDFCNSPYSTNGAGVQLTFTAGNNCVALNGVTVDYEIFEVGAGSPEITDAITISSASCTPQIETHTYLPFGDYYVQINYDDGTEEGCTLPLHYFTIQKATLTADMETEIVRCYSSSPSRYSVQVTPELQTNSCSNMSSTHNDNYVFEVLNEHGNVVQVWNSSTSTCDDDLTITSLSGAATLQLCGLNTVLTDYLPHLFFMHITHDQSACEVTVPFTLQLIANPDATIAITPPLCPGGQYTATASLTSPLPGSLTVEYDWTYNQVPLEGNPLNFDFDSDTEIYLTLTVPGTGCSVQLNPESFSESTYDFTPTAQTEVDECTDNASLVNISITGTARAPYTAVFYIDNALLPTNGNSIAACNCAWNSGSSVYECIPENGIAAGTYNVTITDANGCEKTVELTVESVERNPVAYQMVIKWREKETELLTEVPQGGGPPGTHDLPMYMTEELSKCLEKNQLAQLDELKLYDTPEEDNLTLAYDLSIGHYTLYYYDRARNLTATVPPNATSMLLGYGVGTMYTACSGCPVTVSSRTSVTATEDVYTFYQSTYQYNGLNQVVRQTTPDAGIANFRYNDLGMIRFSQNAKQLALSANNYSFTDYDPLGRIIAVGELTNAAGNSTAFSSAAVANNITTLGTTSLAYTTNIPTGVGELTLTSYSSAMSSAVGYPFSSLVVPQYLRNRVAYSATLNTNGDIVRQHYSYDPHGNVKWMAQEVQTPSGTYSGTGSFKTYMAYDYDLISNKVLITRMNEMYNDRFYHKYQYDADNRITAAYTSRDGYLWDADATYTYMAHGPLKNTVIGTDAVQQTDYAYTLQGWLKGINNQSLSGTSSTSVPDVFGSVLGYYSGDYANTSFALGTALAPTTSKYNGNIGSWAVSMDNFHDNTIGTSIAGIKGFTYSYDPLNRLLETDFNSFSSSWSSTSTEFEETFTYDPNGNLRTLTRNNATGLMDDLEYTMATATDHNSTGSGITGTVNNRLYELEDNSANSTTDQLANVTGIYTYDAIGNMLTDAREDITVLWSVSGKITQITETTSSYLINRYTYDPMGNRVKKEVYNSGALSRTDFYQRDAQGNTLAVYEYNGTDAPEMAEVSLYGSSRVGLWRPSGIDYDRTSTTNAGTEFTRSVGAKDYELTDHLGNNRVVVSDRIIGISGGNKRAEILSLNNYYAFGSLMPNNRTYSSGAYRYGFNGKEKDDEVKGSGNSLDFGARIYDSRLGRWLSIDPLTKADLSSYQFGSNNPVIFIDPSGETEFYFNGKWVGTDGKDNNLIGVVNSRALKRMIKREMKTNGKYDAGTVISGAITDKLFVVNRDLLKKADEVLDKAVETPNAEYGVGMKQNGKNYDPISEIQKGKEINISTDIMAEVDFSTEGASVTIHSHLTGEAFNKKGKVVGMNANKPSKDKDYVEFKKFELNIIVGKLGEASATQREDEPAKITPRDLGINFFNSNSEKIQTIDQKDAKSILKDSEKR